MRERELRLQLKKARFTIRSISAASPYDQRYDLLFERIKKPLKHWSQWTKVDQIRESDDFLNLISDLITLHEQRIVVDSEYKARFIKGHRRKKKLIREALKLRSEKDLSRISFNLTLLKKRWRESEHLFQPLEYQLWGEFKRATDPIVNRVNKHRNQVDEIRIRSAQLRYALLKESNTLEQALSESEAKLALRQLIKKWKEIPRVDPYQEQRFWRWTEKSLGIWFRKSG